MNIASIRFRDTISMGPAAIPTNSLQQGSISSNVRATITDHPDPRYLLVTYTDVNTSKETFWQLIPLAEVTTVILKEAPVGKPAVPAKEQVKGK